MRLFLKILVIPFILIIIILLGEIIFKNSYQFPQKITYGVTFSPKYTQNLGLDWQDIYLKTLDELHVRSLRLPTYWDEIEVKRGQYDFSSIDFMLSEAQKRGAKVILVLGARQPRWPECHIPSWAKSLSLKDRQEKTLEFIGRVLERYKHNTAIYAWQVENEPLLRFFGECQDPPDERFLKSEVELVRKLNGKPVIVTDSGELGLWITPMKLSDIFGTTLYRTVYNSFLGFTNYPILPYLYNVKSTLIRSFFAPTNKKTIIIELQAEPWSPGNNLRDTPIEQQLTLFSLEKFKGNIDYAQKTGFDTAYLWGVEWWYWIKDKGYPQYWEFAKTLFR